MTGKFAQIVMGPAGSGKSTLISRAMEYFKDRNRTVHAVNLDPAADELPYEPTIDIREAIDVKDVMQRHGMGPNGGLMFCLEQISKDLEWFDEVIGTHDVDYLLFDLPGQIELFCHLDILPRILDYLKLNYYHLVGVFLLDSEFMYDAAKYMSGGLAALSAMSMMEIPFVSVLSKCDLLNKQQKDQLECYTEMDTSAIALLIEPDARLEKLTTKICELIDQYNMLQFYTLDPNNESTLERLMTKLDNLLDYEEIADTEHELSLGLQKPDI